MEISNLIPHIEALIFASDKPLTTLEMTDLINAAFGFMEDKISLDQIESCVEGIVEKYNSQFYPFEVIQSGGGWQFLTKKEFHKTVAQLNGEKFLKRLSAAALETLAIVAYKQPVTKGEIEGIRGVSSDYAVQKLLEKELIIITGRNEKMPGHPLVYTTSKSFMDYFGINSAEDLPKIKEVLSEQIIQPTIISEINFEQSEVLAVADDGQLVAANEEIVADEESYVNGHSLNNEETEEVTEEFIADEVFIEGDEEETIEKIEEEITPDIIEEDDNNEDDADDDSTDENFEDTNGKQ